MKNNIPKFAVKIRDKILDTAYKIYLGEKEFEGNTGVAGAILFGDWLGLNTGECKHCERSDNPIIVDDCLICGQPIVR
jgi:hypothetical protein